MQQISPRINGVQYLIKNQDDCIQNLLLNGHQWNKEIVDIIRYFARTRRHFLNVGAHIGSVCLPIAPVINRVTAIEAYPPTYEHLVENIALNNLRNVRAINIAVGNSEEDAFFMSNKICPIENKDRISNNTGGMHVFTADDIKNNIRSANLSDQKVKHRISKLDNLDVDDFDIMLVDIEGFEFPFLLGAENKIRKNKPIIIIELWNDAKRKNENMAETQQEVINYIFSLGYQCIRNIGEDFIFVPI
jgi:hypothetical protein